MTKILRITRHADMSETQSTALQIAATKITGEPGPHEVINHTETVTDAQEIIDIAQKVGANLVEAVLPIAILADLTKPRISTKGLPIIRAQMDRNIVNGEAQFTFSFYEIVKKVDIIVEPI